MQLATCEVTVTDERLELLRNMAVFGALDGDTLRFVLGRAQIVTVDAGELFLREGEEGDAAYLLEQGRIEFFKLHEGREYRMRTLETGDCFGEMSLLGHYPRSGYVRALEDCRAIRISYDVLCALYIHSPRQYTTMIMNMARDLSRRLRDADDRLVHCLVAQGTERR